MLLIVDGPEKAGKSTFIAALMERAGSEGMTVTTRKWGKLDDGKWAVDSTYALAMREDVETPGLVIWDRSWASEAVYGMLLGRDRRLATDPWLGEWLYGRAATMRLMLLGPDPGIMADARTPDDLPVDPKLEQRAFFEYGATYGWDLRYCERTQEFLDDLVESTLFMLRAGPTPPRPTAYCGPADATVVMVGERASEYDSIPGGWLPFSTRYTTRYGRVLGPAALKVGWCNAFDHQVSIFDHARAVVACGATAMEWAEMARTATKRYNTTLHRMYHPAALYRWGRLRPYIADEEDRLRQVASQFVTGIPSAPQITEEIADAS